MKKEEVQADFEQQLGADEKLIGFFMARTPFKIWLFFLIGPLAALSARMYYVAVTSKGIRFHRVDMRGKITQRDFFLYNEISSVKIRKGILTMPMKFRFTSGRKLYVQGQLKGVEKIAKITPQALNYIMQHIKTL